MNIQSGIAFSGDVDLKIEWPAFAEKLIEAAGQGLPTAAGRDNLGGAVSALISAARAIRTWKRHGKALAMRRNKT